MNTFATWLNIELKCRGWTQSELARRMGNASSQSTVSRVISGAHAPSFEFCKALAVVFKMRDVGVLRLAGLIDPSPCTENSIEHEAIYEFRQLLAEEQVHVVKQMHAMNLTRPVGMLGA